MKEKDVGFDYNQVVNVRFPFFDNEFVKYETFKNDMKSYPGIIDITTGTGPGSGMESRISTQQDNINIETNVFSIDYNFTDFFKIPILQGRNFDRNQSTDPVSSVLVNESFINTYHIEDPETFMFDHFMGVKKAKIIGVVKDFHFKSLHHTISPLVMVLYNQPDDGAASTMNAYIKINSENIPETINHLRDYWKRYQLRYDFRYQFLDENLQNQYKEEQKWLKITRVAFLFAVIIACLGLFGFSLFSTVCRTKEIGIRKVLGCSIFKIIYDQNIDFIKWILCANIIALPLGWYFMNKWLQDFAYRIDLSIWSFLITAIGALLIAIFTISFQAIRAARANPVESLRYE